VKFKVQVQASRSKPIAQIDVSNDERFLFPLKFKAVCQM